MDEKEILRKQLLELRTSIALTKDIELKNKLKEQVNNVHKAYLELLLEEKGLRKRGR